jgi:DNA invertase Pin-like site-specific DNA recombinase
MVGMVGKDDLARKGVQLEGVDQAIETRTPPSRLFLHLLGAIAEFENELRKERQVEGIAAAQARGVRFGHAHRLSPVQVTELRQQRQAGALIKTLMSQYRLSKASVYRYLRQTGIRLRRDSLVSVMYAEEPNSTTSSVTLQRTDRHEILVRQVALKRK